MSDEVVRVLEVPEIVAEVDAVELLMASKSIVLVPMNVVVLSETVNAGRLLAKETTSV